MKKPGIVTTAPSKSSPNTHMENNEENSDSPSMSSSSSSSSASTTKQNVVLYHKFFCSEGYNIWTSKFQLLKKCVTWSFRDIRSNKFALQACNYVCNAKYQEFLTNVTLNIFKRPIQRSTFQKYFAFENLTLPSSRASIHPSTHNNTHFLVLRSRNNSLQLCHTVEKWR